MFSEKNKGYKIAMSKECKKAFLLICFLSCLVIGSSSAEGDGVEFKSFPVPIRIDFDSCVESSLHLKCRSKSYDLSFQEFLSKEPNSPEVAFQQLAVALREKNLPTCLGLSFRKSSLSPEDTLVHEKHIELMMNRHSKFFDSAILGENFEKLHVSNQFFIGNGGLFIYGMNLPSSVSPAPFRTAFKFETNSENKKLWKPVDGRPDDLRILLREIMDRNAKSPEKFRPTENGTFDYEIPIFGATTGNAVYLQCNGTIYNNIDIFKDTVDPNDEILSFYQRAYHTLRDNSPEAFAQFYTERSREKYLTWLNERDQDYLKSYHEEKVKGGRKVVFVLDANPFYFVFYKKNIGVIEFEDIVRDPKDNKLKLTNFYYNDYVHHYLKNKELFVNPVLKSILKL